MRAQKRSDVKLTIMSVFPHSHRRSNFMVNYAQALPRSITLYSQWATAHQTALHRITAHLELVLLAHSGLSLLGCTVTRLKCLSARRMQAATAVKDPIYPVHPLSPAFYPPTGTAACKTRQQAALQLQRCATWASASSHSPRLLLHAERSGGRRG
jgi:hypothetical protein